MKLTATQIRRFTKLRDFIAKLPPKACDMDTWLELGKVEKDGEEVEPLPKEMEANGFRCGTVGCIGGWTEVLISLQSKLHESASSWLQLKGYEADLLFYEYNSHPPTGFKNWMVRRLNNIIRDREIRNWEDQTPIRAVRRSK